MTPIQVLHCRYDGPIPADALARAMAEEAALPRRSIPRLRIKEIRPEIVISRMARTMRDAIDRRGIVLEADLIQAGFSALDIERFGHRAKARVALFVDQAELIERSAA